MATESQAHPEKVLLIAFGQGRLPEDESSEVEQHLEVCPACCETLLDLKDDTFVGLVRVAKLTEAEDGPDLKSVDSGGITAQDTALKSGLSHHRTGYESEQAATLLGSNSEISELEELPSELADHPRYRIVGLLGRGGMGNVYRAEHRLMSRPVAIKLINSNLVRNRTAVERFRREVQAAAKLSHPNIVAAYDAEQAGDIHFLVMEFVEGTDLATVVKERGPMSVAEACECIQQAANGLQHAHEKGMVHRDIKPHNLMMSRETGKSGGPSDSHLGKRDSRPLVRILDFGLAGFAEAIVAPEEDQAASDETALNPNGGSLTSTNPAATAAHLTTIGSVMGTPDYMAPEQAVDAHSADIRADIYSLGCTMHFLLTGRPPFERDGVAAKLQAHASVVPPSLTEERSDVPSELSDVVARMMAKKPENRFQTPDEVVAALKPFVSPVISVRERPSFPRRMAIAAALIIPMLLLGVIITIATDKGHIEIDAREIDDPHSQIILKKDGKETARIKVKPGHDTQTIDTGEYRVELVSADNDTQLDVFTQHRRTGESVLGIPLKSYLHTMQADPQSPVMIYRGSRLIVRVSKKASAKEPTVATDNDHLQGRWIAKSIKAGNGAMPAGAVPQWTMTFSGQSVKVTSPTGGNEGTFKLDVSKEPKEIDIEPVEGKGLIRGIYRFVGNELEVCIEDSNRKRPIQWDVDAGTRQMLIRLQRDSAKSSDKRPSAPNQFVRDQQAGEWIARIGATQRVNLGGVEKHVAKPDELPDGDWQITEICLWPLRFDAMAKLDKISGLHSLRWMRLFGCQITDDALKQMTDLPNLKYLDLDYNGPTSDASLAHIAGSFPALEYLSLHGTSITDDGISYLGALKRLQVLNVSATKLSGRGLKLLADHPALSELHLGFMTITDEQLQPLSAIPHLEVLSLKRTVLSDQSVALLETFTKLKRLDLHDSTISSASMEKLKSALPNCVIQVVTAEQRQKQFQDLVGGFTWSSLETGALSATDGPQLKRLDDGSIRAEGVNPLRSNYTVTAKTSLKQVSALRLDVMLDETLPSEGPGRSDDGTFVVTGIEVRFTPATGAPARLVPLRRSMADYVQQSHEVEKIPQGQGSWAIWRDGAPLQNQSLFVELDESLVIQETSTITVTLKHESVWPGCNLGRFRLSAADCRKGLETKTGNPITVLPNLITDPSFEKTPLSQLPNGWRAWLNDGPEFRCEVVAGGHTGQHCLKISGKGTRGVVFANDLKVDRSRRYALKGWAKFEGDKSARAIIKLNYFRGSEFLGVHDLVGAVADQGWQHFEKTDALDAFPTADHFYAMCHVEGSGTGWFDDLELIAYDRNTLPTDFDARHGRHNRQHGPNSLHRWVGTWRTVYAFREFDNSPTETKLAMTTTSERTLGDYFLMSRAKAESIAPQDHKPIPADAPSNVAVLGGEERLMLLTFDQNLGAFRQWDFSSNGKAFEWRGPWDNDKQTLDLRLLPDASNLHASEHFIDGDHIEGKLRFQYVMGQRDAGRWTATRKAFDGKVDIPIAKTHAALPAELSQLNKFVGEWDLHATFKPSVWNPQQREERARESSQWVLGGRFVMTRSFNEKDELTSIWLATYDPREKSNRLWSFRADGSSSESRLTWDEAASGFQFRAIDMPSGWTGTGFNHWGDADTFDNTALIKDGAGGVLLDMTQARRRKK